MGVIVKGVCSRCNRISVTPGEVYDKHGLICKECLIKEHKALYRIKLGYPTPMEVSKFIGLWAKITSFFGAI